ncbi:hypothetical protein BBJ28_00026173, partial [Nothophytophthora sp. Chile5]
MAEQIRLSVGVGDDAQTLARDAEESLYRLQHDFESQRSEMQSLRQSHDAYRTQVRDLSQKLGAQRPPPQKKQKTSRYAPVTTP